MIIYKEIYKEKSTKIGVPISLACDVCKKEYNYEKDILEVQEFLQVYFEGGYSSILGDGSKMQADICQYCVKKLLGKYLREID